MTSLAPIFSLIETLEPLVNRYERLPADEGTLSAHAVMEQESARKDVSDTFDQVLEWFNSQTPAHWSPLRLELVFEKTMSITVRPYNPANPNSFSRQAGPRLQPNRLARFLGVVYQSIIMVDTPMLKKCETRWNSMNLPARFDTPTPIRVIGRAEDTTVKALTLHDAISQSIITFSYWSYQTMFTGSTRKNLQDAFKDGQKWCERTYFKYMPKSWMMDLYYYEHINAKKLITKKTMNILACAHQYEGMVPTYSITDLDITFHQINTLLEKTDTREPKRFFSVFIPDNDNIPKSLLYTAHDSAHALALAIAANITTVQSHTKRTASNPKTWMVMELLPVDNLA